MLEDARCFSHELCVNALSYRVNNWYRAIGHGIQLVQATGLKAGRHEEDVTASSDAMRHAYTEAHPTSTLVLPMLLHFPVYSSRQLQNVV